MELKKFFESEELEYQPPQLVFMEAKFSFGDAYEGTTNSQGEINIVDDTEVAEE